MLSVHNFQLYDLSNGRSCWRHERSEFFYKKMDKIYKIPKYNKELYLGGTLMKYLKNFVKPIIFFTIGILLLSLVEKTDFSSIMTKLQANIKEGLKVVKITEEKSEINDENLIIKFRVPNIHYEDKHVEKSINSYIKKNIKEYINVQRQVNKMNQYAEQFNINITYNVVFEDENIINIIIEKDTTWGKKGYKLEKDSYVFSLKDGERIYLDEFLKDNEDYSRVISETIQKKISEKHPLYNNLNIDKNTNYYIEDRYINIYFNPYKQSEDSLQYEFKIPYDIFKNKIEASSIFFLTDISSETIKNDNKYLKSTLEIPIIHGSNSEISDQINKKIKEDILLFYDSSAKEAEEFLDDFEIDESNFVADASYEIKKNSPTVVSLIIKYYKYSGGAHGYYEYVPYNIDMRNGKIFNLKDMFKDNVDYKIIINDEINNQIKALSNKEENLDQIYDFYSIKDNQKFYIEDGNIVIIFDLYEIAPYAAGIPEFSINASKYIDSIKHEYMNLLI